MRKFCLLLCACLLSGVALAEDEVKTETEADCYLYDGSLTACEDQFPFCEYDEHTGVCRKTEGSACWFFDGEPQSCEDYSQCCWYSHQMHRCNSSCPQWQSSAADGQCGSRYQPSSTRRS